MGTYVYRATAKKVKLSDGRVAHLAKYAYKPFWGYDNYSVSANARMQKNSGCYASERMQKNGNFTGLVVKEDEPGAEVYRMKSPVFYDDAYCDEKVVEGVTVAETGVKKIYAVDWYEDKEAMKEWSNARETLAVSPAVTLPRNSSLQLVGLKFITQM
jgi:hypothetical protein